MCSTIWRHGCWNDYSIANASYQTASYIEGPAISPAWFADVCCMHPFYLMCQWPEVSGPCSVGGTDKTKSSAREKCCLMPCSFKPLSRSNTLSSICFKMQQREREAESCACRKEAAWLFLCCCCLFPLIFLHGQDYKYNFCASSPQVHALLSFFLDEITGFRDERLHMFLFHHLLSSFNTLAWLTPADWTEKNLPSPVALDSLRRVMPQNVVTECQRYTSQICWKWVVLS